MSDLTPRIRVFGEVDPLLDDTLWRALITPTFGFRFSSLVGYNADTDRYD